MICFDNIAPLEHTRLLALNGAEIIFFPHNIGGITGDRDVVTVSKAMCITNGIHMVPCHYGRILSDPGGDAARSFGRTCVIAPDGFVMADTGTEPGIASAVIDLERIRKGLGWGEGGINDVKRMIFKYRRPTIYGGLAKEKQEK